MTAHILDLYDIHARGQAVRQVSEHTARLLQQFIGMLYNTMPPASASLPTTSPRFAGKPAAGRPPTG